MWMKSKEKAEAIGLAEHRVIWRFLHGDLRFEIGDLRFSEAVLRIKRGMHCLYFTFYPLYFSRLADRR